MALVFHLLCGSVLLLLPACSAIIVQINNTQLLHEVDEKFISFNLDTNYCHPFCQLNENDTGFDFKSIKIQTLMKGLSPAILRIGGSQADYTLFDRPVSVLNKTGLKPHVIMMGKPDWDNLVHLSLETGTQLLFDLNLQLRFGTQWDPTNAIELFDYSASKGYGENLHFELGNEPDYYSASDQIRLSGHQIGQDFVLLKNIMNTYPNLRNSSLVGPDIIGVSVGAEIISGVASIAGKYLTAITFHHYYFKGTSATWHDYINPHYFPEYEGEVATARSLIDKATNHSQPQLPIWIGETADAWARGTPHVTDRYVSGFLWLDKLGVSGKMDVKIVMRQTFYGGSYGLLNNKTADPTPDYWLSYVHKLLVGTKVLNVTSWSTLDNNVRVYAHCTNTKTGYPAGSVTMFALNVSPNVTDMIAVLGDLAMQQVDVYMMEPGDSQGLLSKYVAVNGVRMMMVNEQTLPTIRPVSQPADTGIKLRPTTFGFFVFPGAKFKICM